MLARIGLILLVAVLSVSAQSYIEQENEISNGNFSGQVKVYLLKPINAKVGVYCWLQASKAISQAYCGPTYTPNTWIQVGAAVGVEDSKKFFRTAGFIWVGKRKYSNLLIVEKGYSGMWYRNVASYQIRKNLTLSVSTQKYSGTGPRVDYAIPKSHFSVGGEYYFNTRTSRFGLKYNF